MTMEIRFTPEIEAKLNELGARAGKDAGYIVQDIVRRVIYHDEAIVAILKSEQS
jgi:predicted DNA-binding protein